MGLDLFGSTDVTTEKFVNQITGSGRERTGKQKRERLSVSQKALSLLGEKFVWQTGNGDDDGGSLICNLHNKEST